MTPAPASGLNALIGQCQRLEAALNAGKDPGTAASMHRFVAEMEAEEGRAPPGTWSPLVLSVLVMAGSPGHRATSGPSGRWLRCLADWAPGW